MKEEIKEIITGLKILLLSLFITGFVFYFVANVADGRIKASKEKEQPVKERYFFIGYAVSGKYMVQGNFYRHDTILPSVDVLTMDIYNFYKCSLSEIYGDYVITSVFEFKDSLEYARFKGSRNEPLLNCDYKRPVIIQSDSVYYFGRGGAEIDIRKRMIVSKLADEYWIEHGIKLNKNLSDTIPFWTPDRKIFK